LQYLSNIELYFSGQIDSEIFLTGEEYKHIVKVMRHSPGDEIYITNGKGEIFLSIIKEIKKDLIKAQVKDVLKYENEFSNVCFCIPNLKSSDRLEFALEKCTEMGITRFIIFNSDRTIPKSIKLDRLEKIVLSAMKQSLRSYLPEIKIAESLSEISEMKGRKILFEQKEKKFFSFKRDKAEKHFFIFGPEGGLTSEEMNLFNERYKLAENRLRTETAVIKCASLITT